MQTWRTVVPAETGGVRDALERLDGFFASDWRLRKEDALPLISSLVVDDLLLRSFLRTHCEAGEWPPLNGAQSFLVFTSPSMIVRLNLWFPAGAAGAMVENYRRYLSIDELHNHEFSFFTACLLGSGYTSTFHVDGAHTSDRLKGERVDLEQTTDVPLPMGTILFVEKHIDYHSQRWPDTFSVTVNFIPRDYEHGDRVQYVLDNDHRVKTIINTGAAA